MNEDHGPTRPEHEVWPTWYVRGVRDRTEAERSDDGRDIPLGRGVPGFHAGHPLRPLLWIQGVHGCRPISTAMPSAYAREFDFDLARAVVDQLVESLDALPVGGLTPDNLAGVKGIQGIYQLFHEDVAVYVGKADLSLRGRLQRHRRTLAARQNIHVERLGFKGLYIHKNWTTWTSEDVLLRRYAATCAWNNSGYGSNDPGRNREDTDIGAGDFHQQYPIRADWVVNEIQAGPYEANVLLKLLKSVLPYLFRYETDRPKRWKEGSRKYNGRELVVERAGMTAEDLIASIARQLGPSWQATRFPSRYILYEENRTYVHGIRIEPPNAAP